MSSNANCKVYIDTIYWLLVGWPLSVEELLLERWLLLAIVYANLKEDENSPINNVFQL